MTSGKIYILTGEVNSGKTTALRKWCNNIKRCGGILQPKINGERYITNIRTGEKKLLSVSKKTTNQNVISVGNYTFSNLTFTWARNVLLNEVKKNPPWFIVDEFGKLELKGLGLEPAVGTLINSVSADTKTNMIIVIRDYLVGEFQKKYRLPVEIIDKDNLSKLF